MNNTLREAVKAAFPFLTVSQHHVLQALLYAPGHSASAGKLKTLLGLAAVVQVNAAIGQAGRKVHRVMGAHPDGLAKGEFEWWHMLATGTQQGESGFVWTLRDEVVEALFACGLSSNGPRIAEEVLEPERYVEGARRSVVVNAYERNPVARTRCIQAHGAVCTACGIDFGKRYGPVAAGYIHVHHLRALSTLGQEYEVDPVQDLVPLCPNCHAVIHMANPPYTVEQLKTLLRHSSLEA